MVVSRSEQLPRRSKKGGETTVLQPPTTVIENGKRTKVHAQRKFAQGSALSSPALTPVKDKHKSNGSLLPAEIIPAKRPKTHDFLTFLCLRGTSILPTRLDFFSVSSADNQNDDDYSNSSMPKSNSKTTLKTEKSCDVMQSLASRRSETAQQNGLGAKKKTSAAMPTNAVQALKKKYQDQRLSKQNRSGVLNKLAQKVKDKNMVRTRSTGQVDHQKKHEEPESKSETPRARVATAKTSSPVTSEPRRATRSSGIPLNPVTPVVKKQKKRIGLRSGGRLAASREMVLTKARQEKARKAAAAAAASTAPGPSKKNSKQVATSVSDFSSDDDEPLANKTVVSKTKAKPSKAEVVRSNVKQVAMQRLKQAKDRQRKASLSPVRMQTRSKRGGESVSVSPERKDVTKEASSSNSPQKPPARLSRKTKEAAAVYMELLGKKWMSPDDEDDDDDEEDDAMSLYGFPELRRQSVEKKETPTKKVPKKKTVEVKKTPEIPKKKTKKESRDSSLDAKKDNKKEDKVGTRQRSLSTTSSPPLSRRSSIASSPQRRSSVTSPLTQRRSLRGLAPPEPVQPSKKIKDFTDSDEEPLGKKLGTSNKKSETSKHSDGKKKLKKKDKTEKVKSSLSSIAKRTRLRSEKLRLSKETKKGTLNKLLEQQKKKYLCTRKSKEACIQELIQSTMERLNKEEKEEMKRAQEMDLQLQAEKVELPGSKLLDPILLDKKLKSLASTSQEEKQEKPSVKKDSVPASKLETKPTKSETKAKSKMPNKVAATSGKALSKKALAEMPRFVAKKSASIHPISATTAKKTAQLTSQAHAAKKTTQERSISLPCSPLECRTPLTHPEATKEASHCTKCGRGENSQHSNPTENKCETVTPIKEIVSNAVKNLNWSNISSVKVRTQTVKVSNTMVVTQNLSPPPLTSNINATSSLISQHNAANQQIIPTQPLRLAAGVMSGLAMLKPVNQRDLLLLTPQDTAAGSSKIIFCHKDGLATLESNATCSSSGLQFMMVPTNLSPENITVTSPVNKQAILTIPSPPVPVPPPPPPSPVTTAQEVRNFRFKRMDSNDNNTVQTPDIKIAEKSEGNASTCTSSQINMVPKSPEEKRPIFQRRHEKTKTKRADAFSPENESSVYAFQTEPEEVPAGIPFRRKTKDDSNSNPPPTMHSVGCSTDSPPTKITHPSTSVATANNAPPNTYVSRNVSSNSIAVQVNFDEVASTSSESPSEPPMSPTMLSNSILRNSFECSTQTEEENDDDHLFYIPLQRGAPQPQQLIQGVEVKLGTEGPTGPNQRVIMRAKLVTKPPERFSAALNKTGMVRSSQHPASLLGAASSANSKTPLVGTVQPTARPVPQPSTSQVTPNVPPIRALPTPVNAVKSGAVKSTSNPALVKIAPAPEKSAPTVHVKSAPSTPVKLPTPPVKTAPAPAAKAVKPSAVKPTTGSTKTTAPSPVTTNAQSSVKVSTGPTVNTASPAVVKVDSVSATPPVKSVPAIPPAVSANSPVKSVPATPPAVSATSPVKSVPATPPVKSLPSTPAVKTAAKSTTKPQSTVLPSPTVLGAPTKQASKAGGSQGATKQKTSSAASMNSSTGPTKAQKVMNKRNSVEQSPSTSSAGKPTGKKQAMQRQNSTSNGSKMPKMAEPIPTPASFPSPGTPGILMEAPTFHPTEKDFQDPMEYIERIRPMAEQFGLCRIVPPSSFKPECKVSDDMRFTAYNHYVHKMLDRWGPNVKETTVIKKYLKSQNVAYTHPPWIGGMEIDLPRFYQTVQNLGGLMDVIRKKNWNKVGDAMKIPKSAQDRVTKLDDIYCKFLLAYSTLSPEERQAMFTEVEEEWAKKQELAESIDDDDCFDESEECITKGRSMPLNAFYRIARNTMSMWFRNPEPPAQEVEAEYWRIAQERMSHVCVHAGSIDSGVWGYGFPCNKNSPCAKHPWNLKVLSNNSGTILRSMGSVMGVTVPTLHVGMLFSTCCWYRDPHGLPWIEYLHTGASKIWYGIPDSHSTLFRNTLNKVVPKYCRDQTIWLPSDTAMVPPSMLIPHGVSVCHTVQEPGQFILVFPRAFTSSVCTGYLVSESVYFAQPSWLATAEEVFKELKDSCEPTMFSLDRLLFNIAQDHRCSVDVLKQAQSKLQRIVDREEQQREVLLNLGLKSSKRLPLPDATPRRRKPRAAADDDGDYECEVCRANLYLSLVTNSHEECVYCLPHAIALLTKKKHHLKFCKLLYTYEMNELHELLHQLDDKIETKSAKKSQNKHASSSHK